MSLHPRQAVWLSTGLLLSTAVVLAGCSILPTTTTTNQAATTTKTNTSSTTTTNSTNQVNTATIDVTDEDEIDLVTEDAYGKDLDWLPRYSGSIRSYYSADDSSVDITYQTTAKVDDLRTYFDDQLTKQGWTKFADASDYIEYTKGDKNNPDDVTVWFTEYKAQGIVEYEIDYEIAVADDSDSDTE